MKEGWTREKVGLARFYSGSDEARKRNKEKMYTRERQRKRTRDGGGCEKSVAERERERKGSSKLLYPGRAIGTFRETRALLFFRNYVLQLSKPILSSVVFLSRLADFYDSNDRPVNE